LVVEAVAVANVRSSLDGDSLAVMLRWFRARVRRRAGRADASRRRCAECHRDGRLGPGGPSADGRCRPSGPRFRSRL